MTPKHQSPLLKARATCFLGLDDFYGLLCLRCVRDKVCGQMYAIELPWSRSPCIQLIAIGNTWPYRDMRMGDVCAGFEAGANVNTVSGVRGSASMLEASMAAMSLNASQQQQQQQQQQFIDACSASMLEQVHKNVLAHILHCLLHICWSCARDRICLWWMYASCCLRFDGGSEHKTVSCNLPCIDKLSTMHGAWIWQTLPWASPCMTNAAESLTIVWRNVPITHCFVVG